MKGEFRNNGAGHKDMSHKSVLENHQRVTENLCAATMCPTTKASFLLVGKLLLVSVFAISFRQLPLYSANQNTYFLPGLANAGVGFLNLDWQSQTTDPFPVFSTLVSVTIHVLGDDAFYFIYVAILALYAYSLAGIACYAYGIDNSRIKYLCYFALLTMWYSGLLVSLLSTLPVLSRLAFILDPDGPLTRGVAGQYILAPIFQPSAFGVFLVFSIYSFLREKPFVAVACLSIAATCHPTYLLSAAVLTCSYMTVIVVKEKTYRKALLLGTIALLLVTPILTYAYLNFRATNADVFAQAQRILVDYRMPHHARVTSWFCNSVFCQIIVVALAIYLVRRTTLFAVLLIAFLAAMILTFIQVLTGNKALALLFPWRMSVFLVPIASSVILASIVSAAVQICSNPITKIVRPLHAAIVTVIIACGYSGVHHTITRLNTPKIGHTAAAQFAARTFQPGNLYLIPPDLQSFRVAARVPILVDAKSHPYKDTEVIEWFQKLEVAKEFYASSGPTGCSMLTSMSDKHGISHVLLRNDSDRAPCAGLHEVYRDPDWEIYEVQNHP